MPRLAPITRCLHVLSALTVIVAAGLWLSWQALTTYLYVAEVDVPAVVGKTPAEAVVVVHGAGMSLESVERGSYSSVPEGHILWQDPPPGKRVKRGRPLNVRVSLGVQQTVVPDLIGRPLHMAQVTLEASGLRVVQITREYDDVIKRQAVVGQVPRAGTLLPVDSPITLVVSRGPKPVEMPMLVGRSLDDIRMLLDRLGLAVAQVTHATTSDANVGIVLAQAPLPRATVAPGETRVSLIVGVPPTVEAVLRTSSPTAEP